ncbi:MAG: hypothetical protein AB1578_20960 [Thermodesulfobacteriota bacterium]
MALTAASMAAKIQARMDALAAEQFSGAGGAAGAAAKADAYLLAFCQGVIDEIQQHAVVTTTSGAPDGEHTGIVS